MEKKYNVGDRVVVIENSEIRKGTISVVIDNSPVVIVRFDDGEAKKCQVSDLAIMPKTEPQPEEKTGPTPKPSFKSEITITSDEFSRRAVDAIRDTTAGLNDEALGVMRLSLTIFTAALHKKLFGTESDG